jgi:hypothetical protein
LWKKKDHGDISSEETRDKVDYGPLLFTNRDVTVYDYPFSRGCIDNYLPDQIYQELLKAFPTEAIHINYPLTQPWIVKTRG